MRLEDRSDEGVEVALEIGEIVDMALARVSQRALRAALAAPVHARHGEAAGEEIAHHFEVLFDELSPPAENGDRSRPVLCRDPARGAQPHAVGRVMSCSTAPGGAGLSTVEINAIAVLSG